VCKSINTKPRMIKIILSHARLKICIRRGMQVLKSVNTKPCMIKKNDIAHTTFHYKYTNKES